MEADSTIVAAGITMAGTAIAAVIAYIFKTRQETRKSVRKVLYCLLEMRAALSNFQFNTGAAAAQMIELMSARLLERWQISSADEVSPEVHQAIAQHFSNLFLVMRPQIDPELIKLYHRSLLELSQTHPILAFKLRGNEKLLDAFVVTEQYTKTVVGDFVSSISDKRLSSSMSRIGDSFKDEVFKDMVDTLNKDIHRLAWASSTFDYIRCKRISRKSKEKIRLDFSQMNEFVDDFITQLSANLSASSQLQNATSSSVPKSKAA